jgi:hypothetical protein
LLDAGGCLRPVVITGSVNYRKSIGAFAQKNLEFGGPWMVEIRRLVPDNKLLVRWTSQRLREDTTIWTGTQLIRTHIIIVRKQGVQERTALIRIYRHALIEKERLDIWRAGEL